MGRGYFTGECIHCVGPLDIVAHSCAVYVLTIIIIIIIIITTISFMQGIYTYIPETNNVPKEYNVAAILLLLCMVPISLVCVLTLQCTFALALSEVCAQCPIWHFYYYYYYLLQLSFHSVAVVLTLVQYRQNK
jgi:O-antigen/teichoic acid export membrane protein